MVKDIEPCKTNDQLEIINRTFWKDIWSSKAMASLKKSKISNLSSFFYNFYLFHFVLLILTNSINH
ncbi:hypothetical protein GLYMA_11G188400v4 [Glycine max]|uniref:Uncharacterized protein n=1 Tax=Glycine max TaxID=3847 RepID=K7LQ80_SOYBN|nr:hypothetical protein JHK85_031889 [Glycine max]KAH1159279.1 hypothetical protein GYH30_031145 [Glycine max]KRH30501.1 hypothetical protein GLYMA_11G188400v4 [Glycine max]